MQKKGHTSITGPFSLLAILNQEIHYLGASFNQNLNLSTLALLWLHFKFPITTSLQLIIVALCTFLFFFSLFFLRGIYIYFIIPPYFTLTSSLSAWPVGINYATSLPVSFLLCPLWVLAAVSMSPEKIEEGITCTEAPPASTRKCPIMNNMAQNDTDMSGVTSFTIKFHRVPAATLFNVSISS